MSSVMASDALKNFEVPGNRGDVAPILVLRPAEQTAAVVFASPHSGSDYPEDFVRNSKLDPVALRRSEDCFVDDLFAAAPALGAPLLKALFPRAYCDPNREPYELDPAMFADPLPDFVNTASQRVAMGFGTIAKVVSSGAEIYRDKLRFAEADARIDRCWRSYHAAQSRLVAETRARFGVAMLVDCHSMPSVGGPTDRDPGQRRPDIALGDRFGTACHPALIDYAESVLRAQGLRVARNDPYAGGYTTESYGRPREGVHALQIEINRGLYMDENRLARLPGFSRVAAAMTALIRGLGDLDLAALRR